MNQVTAPGGDVFDAVHARLLRYFPEEVIALGGRPEALLRQAGISAEQLLEDSPGLSYRQMILLLDLAATALNCPDFGLRLASRLRSFELFGPLGVVMRNSRNFGAALSYVATHNFAHSLAARIRLKPHAGNAVVSTHDILLDGIGNRAQAVEHLMLAGHVLALQITGGRARARKILFRHQPLSSPRTYRSYFHCEILFGQQEDGVVFSAQDLASPIVDPDEDAYRKVTCLIAKQFPRQPPPLSAQVHGLVREFLGSPICTNDWTAARLNLHSRTLHRRLAAQGTSFQRIKDEIRRDALLYYIRHTSMDFTRISERLGFAEQSVMTRSCRRWFDDSPTNLRLRGANRASLTAPDCQPRCANKA